MRRTIFTILLLVVIAAGVSLFINRQQISAPVSSVAPVPGTSSSIGEVPAWPADSSIARLRLDTIGILAISPENLLPLLDVVEAFMNKIKATRIWKAKVQESTESLGAEETERLLAKYNEFLATARDNLTSIKEILLIVRAAPQDAAAALPVLITANFYNQNLPAKAEEALAAKLNGANSFEHKELRVERMERGKYKVSRIASPNTEGTEVSGLLSIGSEHVEFLLNAKAREDFFAATASDTFKSSELGRLLLNSNAPHSVLAFAFDHAQLFELLDAIAAQANGKNSLNDNTSIKNVRAAMPMIADVKGISGSVRLDNGLRGTQCLQLLDGSALHGLYQEAFIKGARRDLQESTMTKIISERSILDIELLTSVFSFLSGYYRQVFASSVTDAVTSDPDFAAALERIKALQVFFEKYAFSNINLLIDAPSIAFMPEVSLILAGSKNPIATFLGEFATLWNEKLAEFGTSASLDGDPARAQKLTLNFSEKLSIIGSELNSDSVIFTTTPLAVDGLRERLKDNNRLAERLKVAGQKLSSAVAGSELSIFLSSKSLLGMVRPLLGMLTAQVPAMAKDTSMLDEVLDLIKFNLLLTQHSHFPAKDISCSNSVVNFASE